MRTTTALLTLVGLLAPMAFASPAAAAEVAAKVADSCGALGVMNVNTTTLPANVDPTNIRTCADHPAGSPVQALDGGIAKRDCYYGAPFGCSKGYCWKQCGPSGSGQWCWTATNGGYGDWSSCSNNQQCSEAQACGIGGSDCKACGCSC
ncbi:hypothetical protein QBC43DRAFT_329466 [Cladorrhinum sp. PSN259]|nr:hypothetical protein QBC43DRAFT_329466 [Cladorrhinum sp. PSN259]